MKKTFITFTNPKNFVMTTGMFILMPFTYAINQNIPNELGTSNVTSATTTTENAEYLTSAPKFMPIEKARKGLVQTIDSQNNSFVIKVGDKLLPVENNAATTVYFGDGEVADFSDLNIDMKIYVFGYLKSDNSMMAASKIVIANKSKF